ncbi:probable RNA helicase SDE3 [Diospyros lotus]|uniref:probable RNA helicase SDE3 n=1 Tax=Diospyros lotus TaxID=55363 RepID=UPI00224DEE1E|nr:probable RNA helicase SDE3 [Diospyros lotus]XP_052205067.1 probable RNA helicase SDE3 [Diospyros lotus]
MFLEIFRSVLRLFGKDEDETSRNRRSHRNDTSVRHREVFPSYDTSSRTSAPTSTIYSPLTNQSGARIATRDHPLNNSNQVHTHKNFNLYKSPETSIALPAQTSQTSNYKNPVPTKLPDSPGLFSVKPKSTIASVSPSVGKQESDKTIREKPYGIAQKPNILPPSPSPTHISHSKATEGTGKTTDQRLPKSLSSLSSQPQTSLSKSLSSSSEPLPSLSTYPLPSPKRVLSSSSSSYGAPPSPLEPLQPSTKPTLYMAPSNSKNQQGKTNYICVDKGTLPIYAIPDDIKELIKKDVIPGVLRMPLSTSTYKDYFAALLYAEDFYIEKWDQFEMTNVTLELHEAAVYKGKRKCDWNMNGGKDEKIFVAFDIDSVPHRRPFLLSRDFVSVRPSGKEAEPFQGLIYRVVKGNHVLAEFGEDFYSQHRPACKYDVKFSFNRVCLKRAHQAVAAVSNVLFRSFLFPDCVPLDSHVNVELGPVCLNLDWEQVSAVRQILSHQKSPPYLVEGTPCVNKIGNLSRTGGVLCEAVLQIYRAYPSCRILICAPINKTCDVITRSLTGEISESDMFRANAAFREMDGVPVDIHPTCRFERECFSCPSIQELKKFKVIVSTFMSSYRLHSEGIMAGHFGHIFLVDASSATEPEVMVTLANLANDTTTVVVSGAPRNHSGWIRSKIARENGLTTSYFERLQESKLYSDPCSRIVTQLKDAVKNSDDSYSSVPFW